MSLSVTALCQYRASVTPLCAEVKDRWQRRKGGIASGLLALNALTVYPGIALLSCPLTVGKEVAQAVLPLAMLTLTPAAALITPPDAARRQA